MQSISVDQVRSEVFKFWSAFEGKTRSSFEEQYSPTAGVFAVDGRRSEPARLMWVRRDREFFGPQSSVRARLGTITVQLLGANLAVAAYPLQFSVVRTLPNGKRVGVDVPFCRATQVFQIDEKGKLLIIHEHLSSAEPVAPKELPSQ